MLDKIVQELSSHGFFHSERFLSDEDLTAMTSYFAEQKENFEAARIGRVQKRQRLISIRGDYTYWLDPLAPEPEFLSCFTFLNELKLRVNREFYLGLQEFECHLTFYPIGTFYKTHLDRFSDDSSRRLSFIFYLNQEWNEEDGGELVIYDHEGNTVKKISPMPGSFVCFFSDQFPHEVLPALKERRSLTGWMHSKIIY